MAEPLTVTDKVLLTTFVILIVSFSTLSVFAFLESINIKTPIHSLMKNESGETESFTNWYNYRRFYGNPTHWHRRRFYYGSHYPWYWNRSYVWGNQYRPVQL